MFISRCDSSCLNGIGSFASAAYIVILRVYDINASIYQNSSKAMSNYTAQCCGAKKYTMLYKGLKAGLIQGILLSLPFLIVCISMPFKICSVFFQSDYSGEAMNISVRFLSYYLPFIFFNLINNLFHAFYRGVKALNFLVAATSIGAVSRIVLSYILALGSGMDGVFLAWIISWIIEAAFTVIVFLSKAWMSEEMKTALNT